MSEFRKLLGESALLSGGTRNATVRCSSSVEVLKLERDDFLRLAEEFPEFRHSLELTARWRAMHGFLYEFSNFGRLPAPALLSLVGKRNPKEFAKGEIVLHEGGVQDPGRRNIVDEAAASAQECIVLDPANARSDQRWHPMLIPRSWPWRLFR